MGSHKRWSGKGFYVVSCVHSQGLAVRSGQEVCVCSHMVQDVGPVVVEVDGCEVTWWRWMDVGSHGGGDG